MDTAILFLIFNRPDTTKHVFQCIKKVKPKRLYIAADGPRKDRVGEYDLCEKTRNIVNDINWECEVKTLFRQENLGCGKAVSSAITWFFENEEEGIILEDDIVPHPDFFPYCEEMLERYRHNELIQLIAGHNAFYNDYDSANSYYMSSLFHIWGWATWRRVWKTYEFDLKKTSFKDFKNKLNKRYLPCSTVNYWIEIFKKMQSKNYDTWDYQLYINQILYDRYSVIPYKNMTTNIGFNSDYATHTKGSNMKESQHKATSPYPLKHLENFSVDIKADKVFAKNFGFIILPLYLRIIKKIITIIRKHK